MDLFTDHYQKNWRTTAPLAERLRPTKLEDFVGQEEIVGPNSLLRKDIAANQLSSLIFWGPPGSGKTTLATVIANLTKSFFIEISAVSAGITDLRTAIKQAADQIKFYQRPTILFVDEIHRWNKAQQDALLPYVEKGLIILIGATTENPSFEVIAPLLSRVRIFTLKPLTPLNLKIIINRALKDEINGLGKYRAKIDPAAENFLIQTSNGDARVMLNVLEVAIKNCALDKFDERLIDINLISEAFQHPPLKYDKSGEEHYNVISAFIKSMRGSDVDAALYWLARLLTAGEDPKFIARRMIIFSSEDIGNADSMALVVANAVFSAVEKIGLPECRINLAQGVVYLAKAPKSNKSYLGLLNAEAEVKQSLNLPVPLHLRNAVTNLMKEWGYGENYKYPHLEDDSAQKYLPDKLIGKKFYHDL
ncbi:MAG TPA: replication-associated recombination protein A [bacterium]|nr:replication-associated recombination protein A [bacterium]HPL95227.1 replication-associated recombination protein A [bacterium]